MEINIDLLMQDIKDTIDQYENVKGIVLQVQPDEKGHIDRIGMFLTYDDVEVKSLYGAFEVFDFNLEGVQVLYDAVVFEFANLDVNLIMG